MGANPKSRRFKSELIEDAHIISETKSVKPPSVVLQTEPIPSKIPNNIQDAFDPIPEVGDSPVISETIIERKVEETFFNTPGNSTPSSSADMYQPHVTPNAGSFYQPTPIPDNGMGKDFSLEDPEAAILQQRQQQKVNLDEEMANESTNMIGDMLLDGFAMVAPELAEAYYSVNESEIKKLELEGKIKIGSLDYIKQINQNNQGAVKFDKTKKNFIKGPLYKVLEIQGVKGDPTSILIIAIVFVVGMMWFESWKIKKQNDSLISKLVELNKTSNIPLKEEKIETKQAA
jgi:hypothetical protein